MLTQTFNDVPTRQKTISWWLPQRFVEQNQFGDYNVTSFIQFHLYLFLQSSTNTTLTHKDATVSAQNNNSIYKQIVEELSYRKQIARQLCIQYVEGIYDIPVTLKSRLTVIMTFKRGSQVKLGCGFLFAFYSNYGRICSRLWDIQCQRMAWPWNPG